MGRGPGNGSGTVRLYNFMAFEMSFAPDTFGVATIIWM